MKSATKRAVVFSGVVLAAGIVVFIIFYTRTLGILKQQIGERLEIQAFNTVEKFDRIFYERYLDMKMLASDPVISSRSATSEQITQRLLEWRKRHTYYASLALFDSNRIKRAGTSPMGIGEQHPLTAYMKDIAEGKNFIIGISESKSVNDVAFYFASPVKDGRGHNLGVVSARMPMDVFHEIAKQAVASYREAGNMTMDLVDKDGLILYSDHNKNGILKETFPGWESIKQSLAAAERPRSGISYRPGIENEVHIFAPEPGYLDFVGNDWVLILHVPAKEAFAPAVEMRLVFLFIGAFVILAVLFYHIMLQRSLKD
jgi:hypothetical protein